MSRPPCAAEGGLIYHALNRAVARATIFDDGDYDAFLRTLAEAASRRAMRTLLDARQGPTGMVGDGVSVALGGISSAGALETADVVLMADDLAGLPWLVRHSRRTLARIRQNIALALAAKGFVLVLAALGYAGLGLAIAADLATSLLVTANALHLLRPESSGFRIPARRAPTATDGPSDSPVPGAP